MLTLMAVLLRISGEAFIANAYSPVHCYMTETMKATRIESARINTLLIEAGLVV